MPGTVLTILHRLTLLIVLISLNGRDNYLVAFANKGIEEQGYQVNMF